LVTDVQQGKAAQALYAVPEPLRGSLVAAIHSSFASSLDVLLVISAVLALVGTVCSFALIRSRDFVVSQQPHPEPAPSEAIDSPA
jgi:hypothetical protein